MISSSKLKNEILGVFSIENLVLYIYFSFKKRNKHFISLFCIGSFFSGPKKSYRQILSKIVNET
jgi:hypothetical protein